LGSEASPRESVLAAELESCRRLCEELTTIIDSSYDGIYITDAEGRARIVNDAYFRITGLSRGDVFGKSLDELIERGVIKESVARKILGSKGAANILQEIRGRQVIITGTPVYDEAGGIRFIVINIRDITELNTLKSQLESTRRLTDLYFSELSELRLQQLQLEGLVVGSAVMEEVLQKALRVARVDSTVLLEGESGVGKGIFAKLIHKASRRVEKPFLNVNCGTIPEALMESELFGYERGAFTGASREGKIGLFEMADGGTIFLDEIGELPLSLQVKLLGVLESGEIRKVGGVRDVKVDVRLIAATNRDLEEMIRNRQFREDLFYRLKVVPIRIPPLRSRPEEIPAFVAHFTTQFNRRYGIDRKFSAEAIDRLQQHAWPGNLRELEKLVENMIVMVDGTTIGAKDLPAALAGGGALPGDDPGALDLSAALEAVERRLLRKAIDAFGSTRKASRALGISQASVVRKMKRLGMTAKAGELMQE